MPQMNHIVSYDDCCGLLSMRLMSTMCLKQGDSVRCIGLVGCCKSVDSGWKRDNGPTDWVLD